MKALAAPADKQCLEPIAGADGVESPPAVGIRLTNEYDSGRRQRVGGPGDQLLLRGGGHQVQDVEEQHGVRLERHGIHRIAGDDLCRCPQRPGRETRDPRTQLDPDQSIEPRRRRQAGRPLPITRQDVRLHECRECQALTAADVDQRATAPQNAAGGDHAVHRIALKLPAREFPRHNPERQVWLARARPEDGEWIPARGRGHDECGHSHHHAQARADDKAPNDQIEGVEPGIRVADGRQRECMPLLPEHPRADLNLR